MEFPETNNNPIITLSFLLCMLSLAYASETCDFPAIFNFGDSNSDTGGKAAAFYPLNPPYGETFFHRSTGRYSDGRLIIDFIAESFNLPYLSPYLSSLGSNFKHGADFATAGSTIKLPTTIIPAHGGFSPFYLDVQYSQFRQFIPRSQFIRETGGIFAELVPEEYYFEKALYTFDIGQNDLTEGFLNLTVEEVNATVPDLVNSFSANVKKIYDLGARTFWIHNTGPIGCLSFILTYFPWAEKDSAGCAKAYNEVAQHFNHKLKEIVAQLRKDLPLATFVHVDIYSVKYSLFSEPEKHGFEFPLITCCGYGGKYNFSVTAPCGDTVTADDGTKIVVGSCACPSVRVNWDGAHYTEAANEYFFDQISTGAFSDPPVPLNMACHKTESLRTLASV
uniref:Esterase n=1 Tax=Hevea brasiliensis TaxID=3981 RepID=EST_HEVBR|nr:RecName: Full=Esterase; AltName: Full=Early nodule-specific protein homolog; AltName: Full=Latex allergen Hev b 13; AltName: Allergen=Hev b 13; Flags: Precursor [Hevea brasiliensis]AAP37470.1 ENSP-like protein [Hevea brasiliensis]